MTRPTIQEFFDILPDYVEATYFFILRWETPEPGAPNVDLMGSPYYDDFKAMTHQESAPGNAGGNSEGGETMPDKDFNVGEGIKAAMEARGETPAENEQYLWPGIYSACASNEGLYFYSFASNSIYRLPKA